MARSPDGEIQVEIELLTPEESHLHVLRRPHLGSRDVYYARTLFMSTPDAGRGCLRMKGSEMTDSVRFSVTGDVPKQVVPVVNGRSLIDLVADYETRQHYDVAGGYAGLIPGHFRFGDLTQYYLGCETRQWPERGRAWLLGCDCGEVGCWPLDAKIDVAGDLVVWRDFRQPHRPNRDYRGFGPFAFARDDYGLAVRAAVEALDIPH